VPDTFDSLPSDLAAAHALILAERAARRLEIEKLRRTLYGARSERNPSCRVLPTQCRPLGSELTIPRVHLHFCHAINYEAQSAELQDALQMSEEDLDPLSLAARDRVGLGLGDRASPVSRAYPQLFILALT
jgi:hypothetical protein